MGSTEATVADGARAKGASLLRAFLAVLVAHAVSVHAARLWEALGGTDGAAAADAWIMTEQFVFLVPLFLAVAALLRRGVGLAELAVAVVAAHYANETYLFIEHVHGALDRWRVYPEAFRHGNPNGPINVQYGILTFYAAVLPLLALQCLLRRWRTLGRLFVLLVAVVALGTTYIFHRVVVEADLIRTVAEQRAERLAGMEFAARLSSDDEFRGACAVLRVDCHVLPEGAMAAKDALGGAPEPLARAARQAHREAAARGAAGAVVARAFPVGVLSSDLRGNQFVYARRGDTVRVAVDDLSYNATVWRHKAYFTVLVVAAHAWWVFGGMALLGWHRRRLARRGAVVRTASVQRAGPGAGQR